MATPMMRNHLAPTRVRLQSPPQVSPRCWTAGGTPGNACMQMLPAPRRSSGALGGSTADGGPAVSAASTAATTDGRCAFAVLGGLHCVTSMDPDCRGSLSASAGTIGRGTIGVASMGALSVDVRGALGVAAGGGGSGSGSLPPGPPPEACTPMPPPPFAASPPSAVVVSSNGSMLDSSFSHSGAVPLNVWPAPDIVGVQRSVASTYAAPLTPLPSAVPPIGASLHLASTDGEGQPLSPSLSEQTMHSRSRYAVAPTSERTRTPSADRLSTSFALCRRWGVPPPKELGSTIQALTPVRQGAVTPCSCASLSGSLSVAASSQVQVPPTVSRPPGFLEAVSARVNALVSNTTLGPTFQASVTRTDTLSSSVRQLAATESTGALPSPPWPMQFSSKARAVVAPELRSGGSEGSFVADPFTPPVPQKSGAIDDGFLRGAGGREPRRSGGLCIGGRVRRVKSVPGATAPPIVATATSGANVAAALSSIAWPDCSPSPSPPFQSRACSSNQLPQASASTPQLSAIPKPLFSAVPTLPLGSPMVQRADEAPRCPKEPSTVVPQPSECGSDITSPPHPSTLSAEDRCSLRWQVMSVQLLNRLAYKEELLANQMKYLEESQTTPQTACREKRQHEEILAPFSSSGTTTTNATAASVGTSTCPTGAAQRISRSSYSNVSPSRTGQQNNATGNLQNNSSGTSSPSHSAIGRGRARDKLYTKDSPLRERIRAVQDAASCRESIQTRPARAASPSRHRSPPPSACTNGSTSIQQLGKTLRSAVDNTTCHDTAQRPVGQNGNTSFSSVSSNDHPLTTDAASRLRQLATQIGVIVKCRQGSSSNSEWSQDLLLGVAGALESAAGGSSNGGPVAHSTTHPADSVTADAKVAAAAAAAVGKTVKTERPSDRAGRSPMRRINKSNSPPRGQARRGVARSVPRVTAR